MNPVQLFYNGPYLENLIETEPFLKYLRAEERELKNSINGGLVLDVGCGAGRSTKILSDVADEVVGIDFSERLLGIAKSDLRDLANVRLYLEDAKSTHFRNNFFDYIVMTWNTFGNLYASRDAILKEAARVLKPSGIILLSVFSENVLPAYFELSEQNGWVISQYDENYLFLREGLVSERFTMEKLERICREAGLNPEIKPLTEISYWCEATK